MYLIKQLVDAFTSPLMIALVIAVAALVYRTRGRRRMAAGLIVSAMAVGYLSAIVPVGDALLAPLERQYPPLSQVATLPSVGYVVVLGSGYAPRDGIPITAALDDDGLVRVVEGIRLARRLGDVRLVLSGGAPPGRMAPAVGYAELARDLGIRVEALIILDRPLDTGEEARGIAAKIGNAPFLLVTSAYHMRRAVRLMERAGANPIPAPTGHRVGGAPGGAWRGLLPSSLGLRKTERALHEYLGLAALAMGIG